MHRVVDLNTWERRAAFEFFKDYEDPFFNITANLDVTTLYRSCKESGFPYSLGVLFIALAAANRIREFRLRLLDGRVVEYDRVEGTQTILNEDKTFSFSYYEWIEDAGQFMRRAQEARDRYLELKTFDVETDRLDLIYFSAFPWVSFTSFKHASRLDKTQSVPRMVFGKYFEDQGRMKMPFSVEVHHALMDGYHVGQFFEAAQGEIDASAEWRGTK